MKYRSASATATAAFGAALAEALQPGDVVVLCGDLGAGKTALTGGIARGLGLADRVTSPTFALVHRYDDGPVVVAHVDAWRLDSAAALEDLGLEDVLDVGVITVVEWGDIVTGALPAERCTITLALGRALEDRIITIELRGEPWQVRAPAIDSAASRTLDPDC